MTRSLREAIIEAADRLGSNGKGKGGAVGWLMTFGKRHPIHFAALLGKALPVEVLAPPPEEERRFRSVEEVARELKARGFNAGMLQMMADRLAMPDVDAAHPPGSNGHDHSN